MGNESSKLSEELKAEARAATFARIDAGAAEGASEEKSRLVALMKARDAHVTEHAAADAHEREHVPLEELEAAKKNQQKLLRLSKGDATSLQQRTRETSTDNTPAELSDEFAGAHVQSPPAAAYDAEDGEISDDVLSTWQPRKEPIKRISSIKVQDRDGTRYADPEESTATHAQPPPGPSKASVGAPPTATALFIPAAKPSAPPPINTDTNPAQRPKRSSVSSVPTSAAAKRPTPSAFADERRSAPKTSKRASSPQSPDGSASHKGPFSKKASTHKAERESPTRVMIEERPPPWYKKLNPTPRRNPDEASASALLVRLKDDVKKCKSAKGPGAQAQQLFGNIRDELHTLAFERVSGQLLRNNRMLHNKDGLPQIFDEEHSDGVAFPWDIKADAEEIYNKWCLEDFETDLLRGIIRGKPASKNVERSVDSIDNKYKGRASSKYHGNGLLLNGQWWPTQLTAVRDGAHGATIAGISGAAGEGAYSCIMSGGHGYEDEDHGEWVLYCGTDSTDGSVTEATQRLLESEGNGKPVRFIRSHNLSSDFAPEIGFRYDGLYKVVSYEKLDGASSIRQRHRFRLERIAGQTPIRGTEPEKRPTKQEVEAHKSDKRLRGFT
ncbi:hypothetical protein B0A55_04177 [Friedmanniomyces simplex]|uniref:YDG domain-containing protein n=1 Tax=Friedmanniomyces simplex TaxID=329884 RepID=A0A4U0XQU2_9PEZI|nr:hypothetical protein B0A55_04177 [Friedmanniomyces simplex]